MKIAGKAKLIYMPTKCARRLISQTWQPKVVAACWSAKWFNSGEITFLSFDRQTGTVIERREFKKKIEKKSKREMR